MVCFLLGETIARYSGLPFPGNLLGFVILLAGLISGVVKLAWVERTANFFVQNLTLLLIPLPVGLMVEWQLFSQDLLAITVSIVVSTFIVMGITAKLMEVLQGRVSNRANRSN
jgi:holin-like protein